MPAARSSTSCPGAAAAPSDRFGGIAWSGPLVGLGDVAEGLGPLQVGFGSVISGRLADSQARRDRPVRSPVDDLLRDIARARIGATFNQYAGRDGAVRLANLERYLAER